MVEQERIIELDSFDLLDEPDGLPPSTIRSLRRIGPAALAVCCVPTIPCEWSMSGRGRFA